MSLVQDCVWLSGFKKIQENLGFLKFFSILKIEKLKFLEFKFFFFSKSDVDEAFF